MGERTWDVSDSLVKSGSAAPDGIHGCLPFDMYEHVCDNPCYADHRAHQTPPDA